MLRRVLLLGSALCLTALSVNTALAQLMVKLSPHAGDLQDQLNALPAGAEAHLQAGIYRGSVSINHPLQLIGVPGAVIDGLGQGTVITVNAPDVTVRGVTVKHSGRSLAQEDSGIFVTREADRAHIIDNILQKNLIGVYLKGPDSAVVRGNRIEGRRDLRRNERGNGVHLWNTPGSVVEHNFIRYGRDGIFVTTSRHNRFHANRFEHLRYAIHYMYTHDSEVSANYSSANNSGYALMYSDRLKVVNNVSIGDQERGIFLNFANHSDIIGNWVRGDLSQQKTDLQQLVLQIDEICGDANHLVDSASLSAILSESPFSDQAEAGSCVFMYNANINRLLDNRFEGCKIGIHFTAGSERNQITGNAFIDNQTQVKYVGTRHLEWSLDGRGNYWSALYTTKTDNVLIDLQTA